MTYKINSLALEHPDKTSRVSRNALIEIPEALSKAAEAFIARNSKFEGHYCPQCLKAHLIKQTKKAKTYSQFKGLIESLEDCPAGHLGYYTDGEEMIKI